MGEERLVQAAIDIWRGRSEVFDWLRRFASDGKLEGGVFIGRGPSGVTCGFKLGDDPATAAAQLGFFFAGSFWVFVWPRLQEKVNREWKWLTKEVSRGA